jgi:hypothetical protein
LEHHLGAAEEVGLVEHVRLEAPGVEFAGKLTPLLGRHRPKELLVVRARARDGPLRLEVHAHEELGELEFWLGPRGPCGRHLEVVDCRYLVDALERAGEGQRHGADVDARPPRRRAEVVGEAGTADRWGTGDRRREWGR